MLGVTMLPYTSGASNRVCRINCSDIVQAAIRYTRALYTQNHYTLVYCSSPILGFGIHPFLWFLLCDMFLISQELGAFWLSGGKSRGRAA
jgi:hypothetical protein